MKKKSRKWVVVYYGEEIPYYCDFVLYDTKADAELHHPDSNRVLGVYPILLDVEKL